MQQSERIIWPLAKGETLSNHDWFPFFGHRFLASEFVAECVMKGRREDGFTAVMLWSEAMRQDPAGTLPESDIQLASLARYSCVDEWLVHKKQIMHGWVPVFIEDERSDEMTTRMGHPGMIEQIVGEMFKRKRGRDAAREAQRLAVKKVRIKKKMIELGVKEHVYTDDRAMHAVTDYMVTADLYITPDNVRAAMAEVLGYTGTVTSLIDHRAK